MDVHQLSKLRPLGRSEQLSAVSHELGFFQNVGMSAHYSLSKPFAAFNLRRVVHAALKEVIQEHDILSAIPIDEGCPEPYFARLPNIDLDLCVSFYARHGDTWKAGEDLELDKILQDQHNTNFKTDYGILPFWRLIILQDFGTELSFTASWIFYHGIGDGAAGLIFHRSLRKALEAVCASPSTYLVGDKTEIGSSKVKQLPSPLEELHPLPINVSPQQFRNPELQEWTGNPIQLPCTSFYRSVYVSPNSSAGFAQRCKENGFTVTAGLHAIMAGALFNALPSTIQALTGIIPINLRPWLNLPREVADNTIGSFIDAIKVQIRREDCNKKMMGWLPAALHTSKELEAYLTENKSPTGEPYTSVAFFKGIPDVSIAFKSMIGTNRDAAFEVSNLGRFREESKSAPMEPHWQVGRLTFSRSAVAFGAALTTSAVSGGDGTLAISFSWQEGTIDDSFVQAVIKNVKESFDSEAF